MKLMQNQGGGLNVLLVPLILISLLFLGALGFGIWAYASMQDYKNNSDQKVAAAVKVAEDKKASEKDNEFQEREKEPYRDYKSAAVFGDIGFQYPKTWSGYAKENDDQLDLIMNSGILSGDTKATYAVHLKVENKSYDQILKSNESAVKSGKLRASAFRLAKVPSVLGTRLDGEIRPDVKGSMIVLPLRDKSIVIAAESEQYVPDLDKVVLPTFTFNP